MDGIMFSYHGTNGPELSTVLCLVRQVAVPVGRQTATVFGWVRQNAAPWANSAVYYCLADVVLVIDAVSRQ